MPYSSSSSFELHSRPSISLSDSGGLDDRLALLPKSPAVSEFDHTLPGATRRRSWTGYYLKNGQWLFSSIERPFRTRWAGSKRSSLRRTLRVTLVLIGTFILISAMEALLFPSHQTPPKHYLELQRQIRQSTHSGRGNPNNEKIFIAANIINEKLIRGAWGKSVLELIDILGEDNVFVSIYENDSGSGTQAALRELQTKLPCNSSVVTGDHLYLSEVPKITMPSGETRTKRIAYLAEVRNRALRPLDHTYRPHADQEGFKHTNMKFDRVLFLNDIFFSAADAAQLLFSTNNDKYRAACAIDFVSNVMFYDTFVVRDTEGYGMGLMFYPWFAPIGNARSRNAVLSGTDAVPVRSCWGGMTAFDAQQFQNMSNTYSPSLKSRFRYEPELYWEGAECCLIFADLEDAYGESNHEEGSGVFVNPYIRVAYTQHSWSWLPFFQRYERIFHNLQYIVSKIGYPEYNPRRTSVSGELVKEKVWIKDEEGSGGSYQMLERKAAPGGFCGQRRMFLMKRDLEKANKSGGKNWEKAPVPW